MDYTRSRLMKVTNLVALLAAVLLTAAEFLVFEYDARRKRTGGLGLIEHDVLPRVILEAQKHSGGQQHGGRTSCSIRPRPPVRLRRAGSLGLARHCTRGSGRRRLRGAPLAAVRACLGQLP